MLALAGLAKDPLPLNHLLEAAQEALLRLPISQQYLKHSLNVSLLGYSKAILTRVPLDWQAAPEGDEGRVTRHGPGVPEAQRMRRAG